MNQKHENPWKLLDSKTTYENPWIQVVHHNVLDPSGGNGIYGVVHAKHHAIGILPLDEDRNTWIVGQYRFPLNQYSWELPEGGCPVGESSLASAKRELKEETGIEALNWSEMFTMHLSNCISDETAFCYLAENLTFGPSHPEPSEKLEVKKIPFDDLYVSVLKGEITDCVTIAMVMRARLEGIA